MEMILKNLVLFDLSGITLWSGRAKLRPEDLGIDEAQLPPETLASLGSLKIFAKEQLQPFHRIRGRAHRECYKAGTRFLSGYAVPNPKVDRLVDTLEELSQQFAELKRSFIVQYDDEFENWVTQFPSYAAILRRAKKDVHWVNARLGFGYTPVPINPLDDSTVIGRRLGESAAGIYGRLLIETSDAASEVLAQSFVDKGQVTRRALRPFKAMRDKLGGFSFLRPGIATVIDLIDSVLGEVPMDDQPIKGQTLLLLTSLASLMSDPNRLRDVIENTQPGETFAEIKSTGLSVPASMVVVEDEPPSLVDAAPLSPPPVIDATLFDPLPAL